MKIERINEWFGLYADKILKKRWWILATFVLVIVLSVVGMKRMVKETSFDDYFIEDDPMLVKTEEFKSHFGNDYYVGVLTQCDNHFTKENLTTLRALSNELLDSLSYANKVTSLTDIEFMVGSEDGMTIEQIVPEEIHCSTVHHNIKVAGRYDQPPAKLNKYYMNYCLCLQCWGDVGNPGIDA